MRYSHLALIALLVLPLFNSSAIQGINLQVFLAQDKETLIYSLLNYRKGTRIIYRRLNPALNGEVKLEKPKIPGDIPKDLLNLEGNKLTLIVWRLSETKRFNESLDVLYREALSELKEPREVAILFYSSDGWEYSLLASYMALIKGGKPVDLTYFEDNLTDVLRGSKYLVLVTPPIHKANLGRVKRLIRLASSFDEDPYIDVPYGIMTGLSVSDVYNMVLLSDLYAREREMGGISLYDSIPLLNKLSYIARSAGLIVKTLKSDPQNRNISYADLRGFMEGRSGILYVNLHGNPQAMALTQTGPLVLDYSNVPNLKGAVVLTFSCNTLKFEEIEDPTASIAYNFVAKGASAYVGSNRLEYLYGREVGTSYPDMLLLLTLRMNYTLGEAVMILNNMHIRELMMKGVNNIDAAYEVLIGDPTLRLFRGKRALIEVSLISPNEFKAVLKEELPSIYLSFDTRVNWDSIKPRVEVKGLPSVYVAWYSEKAGEKSRVHIYLTTSLYDYLGNLDPTNLIFVKIIEESPIINVLPYAIILITVLLVGLKVSRDDLKS